MIWLISKKRILIEYANHVVNIPHKVVNWLHDASSVTMYITAQGTNDVYCYKHPEPFEVLENTEPALRDMLRAEGHIMGILEDDDDIKEGLEDVSKELKQLKFSQVNR